MAKTSLVVALSGALLWITPVFAARAPGQICAAAKQAATGKKAAAKLSCYAKYTKSGGSTDLTTCLQRAETKFQAAFQKAEDKSNGCVTTGDAAALEATVDAFVASVVSALPAALAPTSTPTVPPTYTPTPLLSDGATCSSDHQCSSSYCLPNNLNTSLKVCCNTGCPAAAPSSCGNNGNCSHSGSSCAFYSGATTCQTASCTGNTYTPAGNCNGAGSCNSGSAATCPNHLACANATSCATTCTANTTSGCAAGFTCNSAGTACM